MAIHKNMNRDTRNGQKENPDHRNQIIILNTGSNEGDTGHTIRLGPAELINHIHIISIQVIRC